MADLWLYLVALVAAYLLPGPDMLLLLDTGIRCGRRRALAVAAGLGVARALHVVLAATGLAALLHTSPWAYDLVRWLGGAYLICLGASLLRRRGAHQDGLMPAGTGVARTLGDGTAFRRGLLTNLLNPKALLFCSVLLPQFIHPSAAGIPAQFALLGLLLVACGLLFDLFYALAGGWVGALIAGGRLWWRLQNGVFATLLIGLGARLVLVGQR